jgi:hypothetical protein
MLNWGLRMIAPKSSTVISVYSIFLAASLLRWMTWMTADLNREQCVIFGAVDGVYFWVWRRVDA